MTGPSEEAVRGASAAHDALSKLDDLSHHGSDASLGLLPISHSGAPVLAAAAVESVCGSNFAAELQTDQQGAADCCAHVQQHVLAGMLYLGDDGLQPSDDVLQFGANSGGGEDFPLPAASDALFQALAPLSDPTSSQLFQRSDQVAVGGTALQWHAPEHTQQGPHHQHFTAGTEMQEHPQSGQLGNDETNGTAALHFLEVDPEQHLLHSDHEQHQQQYHRRPQQPAQLQEHPFQQQAAEAAQPKQQQQQDPTLAALLGDWMLDGGAPADGSEGGWEATVQQAAASMQEKYTPWATTSPGPLTAGPAGLPAAAR